MNLLGVLVVVQTGVIVGLLLYRARHRRTESELRAGLARIRDVGGRLLTAQEAELSRITRELHDDLGQQLAVLSIDLQRLAGTVDGPAETIAGEALKCADGIATSIRNLSHQLYPSQLQLLGLVAGLEALTAEFSQRGPRVSFAHESVPASLPPDRALCVFRIAEEAMQNALEHGHATTISVRLTGHSDRLELTVVDDGVGFAVEGASRDGLGVISMRERAEAMAGSFTASRGPHSGTRVAVSMPL